VKSIIIALFCICGTATIFLFDPPTPASCGPCGQHYGAAETYLTQKQYARAVNEYSRVDGSTFCRFLANYYSAYANYSRAEELQEQDNLRSDISNTDRTPNELLNSAADQLRSTLALGTSPEIARCENDAERTQIHRTMGKATYTLVLLTERAQPSNPREILRLLDAYESLYPDVPSPFTEVFTDVAEWRLRALESLGDDSQAQHQISQLVESHAKTDSGRQFLKSLGLRFWTSASRKLANSDKAGGMRDAEIMVLLYQPFEDELGTSAHLSKGDSDAACTLQLAYVVTKDRIRADDLLDQIKREDPNAYCAGFRPAPIQE
jgi:hypothetical protein